MENLIKSQKETITDLEAKIQANLEELKKVTWSTLSNSACTVFQLFVSYYFLGEWAICRLPESPWGDQPGAVYD